MSSFNSQVNSEFDSLITEESDNSQFGGILDETDDALDIESGASLGVKVRQPFTSLGRGAVSLTAGAVKGISFLAETQQRFNKTNPGTFITVPGPDGLDLPKHVDSGILPQDRMVFKMSSAIEKLALDFLPSDRRLEDSFFLTKLPAAVGSGLGFMALMTVSGGTGGSAMARSMLFGGSSLGVSEAERAIAEGKDPAQVMQLFQRNFLIGTSEGIPIARIMNRAGSGKLLSSIALAGLEEGTQEGIQNILSNIAAGRPWEDGVSEGVLLGILSGVTLGGAAEVTSRLKTNLVSNGFQKRFQSAVETSLADLEIQAGFKPSEVTSEEATQIIENAKTSVQPNADIKAKLDGILDHFSKIRTGTVDIDLVGEQVSDIVKIFRQEAQSEFLEGVPGEVIENFESLNRKIIDLRGKVAQQRLDIQDKVRELEDKKQTKSVKDGISKLKGQLSELTTKPDAKFVGQIRSAVKSLFKADDLSAQKKLIKTIKSINTKSLSDFQRSQIEDITGKLDLAKPTAKTLESLDSTIRELAENENQVFPNRIIEDVKRLIKKPVSELSGEDARILEKVITHAVNLSNLKTKIKEAQEKRSADTDASESASEMESPQSILSPSPTFKTGQVEAPGRDGYLRMVFSQLGNMTLDTLASAVGGGENTTTYRVLHDDIQEGFNKSLAVQQEGADVRDAMIRSLGLDPSGDEVASWSQEISDEKNKAIHTLSFGRVLPQTKAQIDLFTDASGRTIAMDADYRMYITALSMDASNHDIMIFHRNKDGSKGIRMQQRRVPIKSQVTPSQTGATEVNSKFIQLNAETLAQVKNSLSPQQLALVGAMVGHLNGPFKEMMSKWSQTALGLSVIKSETWMGRHRVGEQVDEDIVKKNLAQAAIESAGIVQERTGGDDAFEIRSLFVEFNNILLTGASVVHMSGPINRAKNMLNKGPVSDVIKSSKNGRKIRSAFNSFYDEAARMVVRGNLSSQDQISTAVRAIARRVTRGALRFSPRVATYQITSISLLKTEISSVDVNRAVLKGAGFMSSYDAKIRTHPRMRFRVEGSNQALINETPEGGSSLGGDIKSRRNIDERGFGMVRGMDTYAIRTEWASLEYEALRVLGETDIDSHEVQDYVRKRVMRVTNRTQPTFDPLSISLVGVESRKSSLLRAITMFRAQRSKNIDMTIRNLTNATKNPSRASILRAGRTISEVWILNTIRIAAIQEMFDFAFRLGKPDDNKDDVLPRFIKRLISISTGNLLVGDPVRFLLDKGFQTSFEASTGDELNDPFDISFSPIMSIGRNAVQMLPSRLSRIADPDDSLDAMIQIERIVEDFGPILGIPVTPLRESRKVLQSLLEEEGGDSRSLF